MTDSKNSISNGENQEQVSRRSFIEKSAFGLGTTALAGNVFAQDKNLSEPALTK